MLAGLMLLLSVSCSLGRPPAAVTGVEIAHVRVPVAQPGLARVLHSELAGALAHRGVGPGSVPIEVEVLDASTRVIAVDGAERIISARLEIKLIMHGARPRNTRLSAEYPYSVAIENRDEGAMARQLAFENLGRRLAQESADWILYAGH